VYAVLLIASTFAFQWNGQLSLFQAFVCMGTAGLGASIPGLRTLYLEMRQDRNRDSISADHSQMTRVLKEHWNYGKWVAALTVLSLATLHIQTLLSAAFLGLEAAGALRAVTNFILPAMQTINSISMLGLPLLSDHFGRGDMKGLLWKSFLITTGLTVLGCAYEIPLLLFNGQLEQLVYGGKFAAFSELIPVMGLIPVFSGLASGYSLALRAVQKPQHYLIVGAITAPIGIVSAVLCTNLWGLSGLAASMVITYASGTAVTFLLYRTWVLPQRIS
jgi:O-antigen/teichoic acid export membrane protein